MQNYTVKFRAKNELRKTTQIFLAKNRTFQFNYGTYCIFGK